MTQRAHALARNLMVRMQQFERTIRETPKSERLNEDEARRRFVEKVLFSEVGLTDYAKAQLVAVAMPRVGAEHEPAARELRELAEFLDTHLDWSALEA